MPIRIICETCDVEQDPETELPVFQIVSADFDQCRDCFEREIAEGLEAEFLAHMEHKDAGFGIYDSRG